MNPFSTTTSSDIGLSAGDIVSSGLSLLVALAPIVLIGLAIIFAPKIIKLIKIATGTSYYKNWNDLYSSFSKEEKKYSDMFMKGKGRDYTMKMKDQHARSIVKRKGLF